MKRILLFITLGLFVNHAQAAAPLATAAAAAPVVSASLAKRALTAAGKATLAVLSSTTGKTVGKATSLVGITLFGADQALKPQEQVLSSTETPAQQLPPTPPATTSPLNPPVHSSALEQPPVIPPVTPPPTASTTDSSPQNNPSFLEKVGSAITSGTIKVANVLLPESVFKFLENHPLTTKCLIGYIIAGQLYVHVVKRIMHSRGMPGNNWITPTAAQQTPPHPPADASDVDGGFVDDIFFPHLLWSDFWNSDLLKRIPIVRHSTFLRNIFRNNKFFWII